MKKTELSLTFVPEYSEVVLMRAGPSFQYFVTDFQRSEKFRYIHIYGCYSRNDYPHQKTSVDGSTMMNCAGSGFVGDQNLDEHQEVGREKIVSTLTRPGYSLKTTGRALLCQGLTATRSSLYVLITLIREAGALSVTELMTLFGSFRRQLGVVESGYRKRQADALVKEGSWCRVGPKTSSSTPFCSILDAVSTEELEQLYVAVSFFCHIIFPSIPGEFLKNTMERYFESRQLSFTDYL